MALAVDVNGLLAGDLGNTNQAAVAQAQKDAATSPSVKEIAKAGLASWETSVKNRALEAIGLRKKKRSKKAAPAPVAAPARRKRRTPWYKKPAYLIGGGVGIAVLFLAFVALRKRGR